MVLHPNEGTMAKRIKYRIRVLAICTLILCAGCGTIVTRLAGPDWKPPDHPLPRIYSGTLFDIRCLLQPGMYNTQGLGGLCLVDVPFSLIADTVILPFTIYDQIKYGSYATGKPVVEKQPADKKTDAGKPDHKQPDGNEMVNPATGNPPASAGTGSTKQTEEQQPSPSQDK